MSKWCYTYFLQLLTNLWTLHLWRWHMKITERPVRSVMDSYGSVLALADEQVMYLSMCYGHGDVIVITHSIGLWHCQLWDKLIYLILRGDDNDFRGYTGGYYLLNTTWCSLFTFCCSGAWAPVWCYQNSISCSTGKDVRKMETASFIRSCWLYWCTPQLRKGHDGWDIVKVRPLGSGQFETRGQSKTSWDHSSFYTLPLVDVRHATFTVYNTTSY